MDGERRCIDGFVAHDDLAIFVDEDQIAHADKGKMLGEGVQPCVKPSG